MKVTENDNGTFKLQSETKVESQVINILWEMSQLAFQVGAMTEDDINNGGCMVKDGYFLNYCTIPSMEWVEGLLKECEMQ